MFNRRMRFQCMGQKRNNTEATKKAISNWASLVPELCHITRTDLGTFTFTATPEEVEGMVEYNKQLEQGLVRKPDINRAANKVVNKFIEPFESYANSFINAQKGRGNKIETIKHYSQSIRKMEQFFFWLVCERRELDYNDALEKLTKEQRTFIGSKVPFVILEDSEFDAKYREFLLDIEEVSEQTVATYFRDYRAIAYFGMDEGLIEKRAIVVKTVYSDPKEVYTDEEIDKLLKKPKDDAPFTEWRNWAIVNWALATGNRIGTVCNVKISDVDFRDNMITVSKQKNGRVHRIAMVKALREVLKFYMNEFLFDEDGVSISTYLFPSSYVDLANKPMNRVSMGHSIKRYNLSRGVSKTSFHLFRHTFVKKWILDGGDLPSLQKILGHSSLNMVVHYANLYSEDLRPKMEEHSVLAKHQSSKARGRMIKRRKH